MLNRFLHLGSWVALALTVAVMLINAFYMLISPRAWFSLPSWLGLQGALTLHRNTGPWGELQVRILGAIIIATVGWIAFELVAGP